MKHSPTAGSVNIFKRANTGKIRVAQLRWGEPTGGPERVLRDVAVYLNREQFDMGFFSLACGGSYESEIRALGYPFSVIPARSGRDLGMRCELARQLRAFRPDLIHEHGLPPLVRPVIKWVTGAPLLSFEHGEIEINRRKGKPWLNWLKGIEYRLFVERIIVNSSANQRLVTETHHLPPEHVQVIHLGLDLEQFQFGGAATAPLQELVLGYVGRLQSYDKGADFLPQLVRQLSEHGLKSFRLKVVGDGPDRELVLRSAEQLGVANRIEFLGRRDDVAELLASMDVLVVPSRLEAFGLSAIEALAVGTRVVAFAVDGLSEVLGDCPEARLVAPGDVHGMAEAVLALWNQYGKQRSLAGRRYVEERFDARRMTRELEQVYRKAARQSKQ